MAADLEVIASSLLTMIYSDVATYEVEDGHLYLMDDLDRCIACYAPKMWCSFRTIECLP